MFGNDDSVMGEKTRARTEKHLENHDIPYDKIRYVPSNKVDECIEEKADVVIEDNPNNIKALAAAGFNVICFRTMYNKHITADMPNVHIALSWANVYTIIQVLKAEKYIKEIEKRVAKMEKVKFQYNYTFDEDMDYLNHPSTRELKYIPRRGFYEKNKIKR